MEAVERSAGGRFKRDDTVTVLGKEKQKAAVPLWSQDGRAYALTEEGVEMAKQEGIKMHTPKKRKMR